MSVELLHAEENFSDPHSFHTWMKRAVAVLNTSVKSLDEDAVNSVTQKVAKLFSMCSHKSKEEVQSFIVYLKSFFEIFVGSSFEYGICQVSHILADAHFVLEKQEAVHNYCYAYVLAEKFKDDNLLNSLASKIHGVEMLYLLDLLCQPKGEGDEHFFYDQLHSLIADRNGFMKLIAMIEEVGVYFLSHKEYRPKVVDLFYELIEICAVPKNKIELLVKEEVTRRLTNAISLHSLDSSSTSTVPHSLKFRNKLQELRCSLLVLPEESPVSLVWSNLVEGFLKEIIDDVLETIGKPRLGIDFTVVVMGSFAREELSLYSDLEMAIIYRKNINLSFETTMEYVNIFAHLFWLRIVGLCEDNSRITRMKEGMMLDSSFSFSPLGSRPLIFEVSELVACYRMEELVLTNQFAKMRFLWGTGTVEADKGTVFEETKEKIIQLIGSLPSVNRKLTSETLESLIVQYENLYDRSQSFCVKEELRLITVFVQVLSAMNDQHSTSSTRNSIRLLVENNKLHRGLGMALSIFLEWLLSLRVRIHRKAGCKDDRFLTPSIINRNQQYDQTNDLYVLSEAEYRRWSLFFSMISSIVLGYVKYLYEKEALPNISSNLPTDRQTHLSCFFSLMHEDELLVFREKIGLPKTAHIDAKMFWQHPNILRSNYYFEMAVECSLDGAQRGFHKLVSEFYEERELHEQLISTLHEQFLETFLVAKDEIYGRRKVIALSSQIHLKFFPELPGQECFASEVAHRITGYTASFSVLRKDKSLEPLLISKTVIGMNLQDLLKENPNALEDMIDDENFSWQFIRTVLLNPEDDKPDNFMVLAFFDEWTKVKRYKLVCVDNDHTLSEPILSGRLWNELLVKTIIYCSESKMKNFIHPNVINYFSTVTIGKLVLDICEAIVERDDSAHRRFSKAELCQEMKPPASGNSNNNEIIQCKIPVLVSEDSAVRLYKKLNILRNLMTGSKEISHLTILSALEPILGNYYGKLLTDPSSKRLSSLGKFEKITSGLYKIVGVTRATRCETNKILRFSCGKAPTEEEIENRTYFTSRQMLKKFKDFLPHQWTNQVAEVRQHLLKISPKARNAYYDLPDDVLREEVISGRQLTSTESEPGINFQELNENQQAFIVNLVRRGLPSDSMFELNNKPHTFDRLRLRYCEVLTDNDLFRILKNSPKLQILDVRDCSKITKDTLDNLKAAYPSLKIFHNPFRVHKGLLTSMRLLLLCVNDETKFGIDEAIEIVEDVDNGSLKISSVGLILSRLDVETQPLSDIPLAKLEILIGLALKVSFRPSTKTFDVGVLLFLIYLDLSVEDINFSMKILRNIAKFCVDCCTEGTTTNLDVRDRLALLWTITKLLCKLNAETDITLREQLIQAFQLISVDQFSDSEESELYEVFGNAWLPLLFAEDMPDFIVNVALECWYAGHKRKTADAIPNVGRCLFLSKVLFQSTLKRHLFIFILQSLGNRYYLTSILPRDELPYSQGVIESIDYFALRETSKQQLDYFLIQALSTTDEILSNKPATLAFFIQCANIIERVESTNVCPQNYASVVYFVGKGLCIKEILPTSTKKKLARIWCDRFEIVAKNLTDSELLELSTCFLDSDELEFEYKAVLLFALLSRKAEIIPVDTELMETLQKFQKQLAFENKSNSSSPSELFVLLLIVYILAHVPVDRLSTLLPVMESLSSKIINSTAPFIMEASPIVDISNESDDEDNLENDGDVSPVTSSSDARNNHEEVTEQDDNNDDYDATTSLHLLKDKSKVGDAIKDILTGQIAMLLKQKLPKYSGALIRSDLVPETPEPIGWNMIHTIRLSLKHSSSKQLSNLMRIFVMYRMPFAGLSLVQQLQLIACLLDIMNTNPDTVIPIGECLKNMIKRGLLNQPALGLPTVSAAMEITKSHKDGGTRLEYFWILVLLISTGALEASVVDNLIDFLLTKTQGEAQEAYDSARHNCFLGLTQIVKHYRLTREQAILIRDRLKESARLNSLIFKDIQAREKDELEELLNGKIFEVLNQIID
jgi:hypothetical protein